LPEAAAPPLVTAPHGWLVGQWRYLVPVTVAAATVAWVLGAISGREHGAVPAGLIVAGAVLTAVVVGLPLRQHRHAVDAQADEVSAAQAARVGDACSAAGRAGSLRPLGDPAGAGARGRQAAVAR
jgi:hypothetical protein